MRKKIFIISVLILIILLCSGCNGTVTRELRHAGWNVSNKFTCDVFSPSGNKDSGYKKVKYITENNIIDNDGRIYEISLGQVYESKQNCKKAATDIYVKAIYDNKIIKATDNKYYYLVADNSVLKYSLVPVTDNSYELYDLLLKGNDVVKVMTINSGTGVYYVLKSDGNIYSYTINRADYNSPLKITNTSIAYDKSNYGSKIIDFNYAGSSSATYIRTENAVYRMKATNYDRCSKYADVDCVYSLVKDTIYEKYGDKIIAFNGSVLITDYNQTFTITN